MNIDIERVKKQYATYGKISCSMTDDLIAGFEQQQKLLNEIKTDLIKRAELKGDIHVDLSGGIWISLCMATCKPPEVRNENRY